MLGSTIVLFRHTLRPLGRTGCRAYQTTLNSYDLKRGNLGTAILDDRREETFYHKKNKLLC